MLVSSVVFVLQLRVKMQLHDTNYKTIILIIIWDSVQQNHPCGTLSSFPEQSKENEHSLKCVAIKKFSV